ncbi:site-2 protease family protein [Brunnivagina elsteri]|uniref:Peptidase M50 n=1 Tax=Brunnivagina elsteri CCALA 953 TaxID=987040 RepID=A0A2A2TND8_9CYAN|nr:site-2 protease family protein [Calothrix elsteri]PAX59952.1 peptidase M50 [Calothrix elsteri CCALA 953]
MRYLLYAIAFLILYKSLSQYPKYQRECQEKVPKYLREVFEVAIAEFNAIGFRQCGYLQVTSTVKAETPTLETFLYNSLYETYVIIGIRYSAKPDDLFKIEFYTFFEDESLLLTTNSKADGIIDETPDLIIQDAYMADISTQWHLHQNKLSQLANLKQTSQIITDEFADVLQTHGKNYIDFLVSSGKLRQVKKDKLFQFNFKTAWHLAKKITHGVIKTSQIEKKQQVVVIQSVDNSGIKVNIPVELEVEIFKRIEKSNQLIFGSNFRALFLLLSFTLFMISYMQMFEAHSLVIFAFTILLHEAGHVIAMKLCGYQDTSILFLPFLGAVATAREKYDTTLVQNVFVLLAGPLPGLILGIFLGVMYGSSSNIFWVKEAAWMLISLNLINLMPIYPLDGGKIANLVIFSKFAYSDIIFRLLGLFILGCFAVWQPVLIVFLILNTLSLPYSFRLAKTSSEFKQFLKENPQTTSDNLLYRIFEYVNKSDNHKLLINGKHSLVKNLLLRYNESISQPIKRLILAIIYFISILGGLIGGLFAIFPNSASVIAEIPYLLENSKQRQERFTQKQKYELEKTTVAITKNPNDVNAYIKRAKIRQRLRDYRNAIADYNQVLRLQPNQTQYRLNRAILYSQVDNIQAEIKDYNYLIQLNPQHLENYISRGYAYLKIQDYHGALADGSQVIKLDPQQQNGYKLRSEARRHLGDDLGADADKQKAMALEKVWEEARDY